MNVEGSPPSCVWIHHSRLSGDQTNSGFTSGWRTALRSNRKKVRQVCCQWSPTPMRALAPRGAWSALTPVPGQCQVDKRENPRRWMMLTVSVLLSLTDALFLIQWCSAGLAGPAIVHCSAFVRPKMVARRQLFPRKATLFSSLQGGEMRGKVNRVRLQERWERDRNADEQVCIGKWICINSAQRCCWSSSHPHLE